MAELVGGASRPRAGSDSINGINVAGDPFTLQDSTPTQHHRYSAYDTQLFGSSHADSTPTQAKRALEAHLAETDRRIQEASKLGTTLVQQRMDLSNRLRDVASQEQGGVIDPGLQQKLAEIEREYEEVGRQSARTFLGPKGDFEGLSRDTNVSLEADSLEEVLMLLWQRPPSPSKLASTAVDTPSRMNVPRKQRNQASNSDHIEFAAEITTSLLGQVRHLQAVLAERDEALKNTTLERSRLEQEAEGFHKRLRHHDDSEQRYKDENWNLETQLQDLLSQHKDATTREQKHQQNLVQLTAERSAYEKELQDLQQNHGKAYEEHIALRKHHESEIADLRKAAHQGDLEQTALQRKLEELTSQNNDLARGLAGRMRDDRGGKDNEAHVPAETFPMDFSDTDHSPPPSPSKGGQRQSALESETLKSSLNHAHRMIQNLKSNINRERAEKQDLKRMLQEARDDVDISQAESQGKKQKTKSQTDVRKLGRTGLGASRSAKTDVLIDPALDPDWEDNEERTPQSKSGAKTFTSWRPSPVARQESSDAYQTATENSDAFETANERDTTDNDAFQTGAESLAGDSSETETETEKVATRSNTIRGPKLPQPISTKAGDRRSFQSTASTSDEDEKQLQTPIQGQPQRFRLKMNRRPRTPSGAPGSSAPSSSKNSPASFVNAGGDINQSLFAELENISGDEAEGTPVKTPRSSRSLSRDVHTKRSAGSLRRGLGSQPTTPGLRPTSSNHSNEAPPVPRMPTVDTGIMTEPWEPSTDAQNQGGSRAVSGSTVHSTPQRAVWDQPLTAIAGVIPGFRDSANTTPLSTRSETSQIRQLPKEGAQPQRAAAELTLSPIHAIDTRPISTWGKIGAIDPGSPTQSVDTPSRPSSRKAPEPAGGILGSMFGWNRRSRTSSVAQGVEDDPAQRPKSPIVPKTPERKVPLQEVSANAVRDPQAFDATSDLKQERRASLYDQGSQTLLSSEEIDRILTPVPIRGPLVPAPSVPAPSVPAPTVAAPAPPVAAPPSMQRLSAIGAPSPQTPQRGLPQDDTTPKAKMPEVKIPQGAIANSKAVRRPTSATRGKIPQYPPLPPDHQEAIAAAAQKGPESMGPPLAPASAYSRSIRSRAGSRPQTPSLHGFSSPTPKGTGGTTPRAGRFSTRSQMSRRSSVSSFASELDERLGIRLEGGMPMQGMPPITDPRMIQAITQTMIGEHMWKYTRKAGRGDMSNTRHRRFFWVHPYTRTLYWSDRDPATANRAELKSKSVAIEAVRVVSDDNPNPPGLHRKSIVIVTPGRYVKFTAQTSHRHETWFNALSYLLLRTAGEADPTNEEEAADIAEFDPNFRPSVRSRVSLASFRSNATANRNVRSSLSSRAGTMAPTPQPPTILQENALSEQQQEEEEDTRSARRAPSLRHRISRSMSRSRLNKATISAPIPKDSASGRETPHGSISSRLSGYWRQPPSIRNSMRSRSSVRLDEARASGTEPGALEAGTSVGGARGDSAEDLRRVIEDRESMGGLENVRACCDGSYFLPTQILDFG